MRCSRLALLLVPLTASQGLYAGNDAPDPDPAAPVAADTRIELATAVPPLAALPKEGLATRPAPGRDFRHHHPGDLDDDEILAARNGEMHVLLAAADRARLDATPVLIRSLTGFFSSYATACPPPFA